MLCTSALERPLIVRMIISHQEKYPYYASAKKYWLGGVPTGVADYKWEWMTSTNPMDIFTNWQTRTIGNKSLE